jgi:Tfp pilus assembly protein PilV
MTRSRAGFSMVEAVVALAIASVGLTAILALQQQLAANQIKHQRTLDRLSLRQSALSVVTALNPEAQPNGETSLSNTVVMSWTSVPFTPARRSIGMPTGDGQFNVRLYHVTVTLKDRRRNIDDQFTVDRLGWQSLASEESDF